MERVLVCTVLLLAGCSESPAPLGPPAASVFAAAPGAPPSVTGSGHARPNPNNPQSLRRFTISAIGRADGSASGQYNLVVGPNDIRVHGSITCLTVVENRVFVGGTLDDSTLEEIFGPDIVDRITGVAIELLDNGAGPSSPPDEISPVGFFLDNPEGPQNWCNDATSGGTTPIHQGNITVRG